MEVLNRNDNDVHSHSHTRAHTYTIAGAHRHSTHYIHRCKLWFPTEYTTKSATTILQVYRGRAERQPQKKNYAPATITPTIYIKSASRKWYYHNMFYSIEALKRGIRWKWEASSASTLFGIYHNQTREWCTRNNGQLNDIHDITNKEGWKF